MKPCMYLNDYLDRVLHGSAKLVFRSHLSSCADCHQAVAFWEKAEQDLKWADGRIAARQPTGRDVLRLMARAEETTLDETRLPDPRENREMVFRRWAFPGALALLIVLGVGVGGFLAAHMAPSSPSAVDAPERHADEVTGTGRPIESSRAVTAPANGKWVVDLGPHRLGLTPLSQVRIDESADAPDEAGIRIRLESGTVACAVSPLRHGVFLVESGEYVVRVVGTRFLVTRLGPFGIRVAVSEGIVSVQHGAKRWQVSKGERLDVLSDSPSETSVMAAWEAEEWESLLGDWERAKPAPSARIALKTEERPAPVGAVSAAIDEMRDLQPMQVPPYSAKRPTQVAVSSDGASSPASELPLRGPSEELSTTATTGTLRDWPTPSIYPPEAKLPRPLSQGGLSETVESRSEKLSRWRQWVIDGMYGTAEVALVEHLKETPEDTQARYLLADCRRKSGDTRGAITAYLDIAATATPSQATRARFMAGTLLQDTLKDYSRALEQFKAYLSAPPALVALKDIARLRLAQCLASLGQHTEARQCIERMLRDCDDPLTEAKARRLLDSLK